MMDVRVCVQGKEDLLPLAVALRGVEGGRGAAPEGARAGERPAQDGREGLFKTQFGVGSLGHIGDSRSHDRKQKPPIYGGFRSG